MRASTPPWVQEARGYMDQAGRTTAAMDKKRPGEPGKTFGGAIISGMAGGMAGGMAASKGYLGAAATGPIGLAAGAVLGLGAYLFS